MEQNFKSQNLIPSEYDKMLYNLIDDLDDYDCIFSRHGTIYFIGDKYVVKRLDACSDEVQHMEEFLKYGEEIKGFHKKGYSVPQIYSTLAIPDEDGYYDFYILEEQIQGRWLYETELYRETYSDLVLYNPDLTKFKKECEGLSEEQARKKIESIDPEFYDRMMAYFLNDFYEVNLKLENLDKVELEKFILSAYNMLKDQVLSYTDIRNSNVMFDGKKLTLIDNEFMAYKSENPEGEVLFNMLKLLSENGDISYALNNDFKNIVGQDLKKKIIDNKKLCGKISKRLVEECNRLIKPTLKVVSNPREVKAYLGKALEENDREEVINQICFD